MNRLLMTLAAGALGLTIGTASVRADQHKGASQSAHSHGTAARPAGGSGIRQPAHSGGFGGQAVQPYRPSSAGTVARPSGGSHTATTANSRPTGRPGSGTVSRPSGPGQTSKPSRPGAGQVSRPGGPSPSKGKGGGNSITSRPSQPGGKGNSGSGVVSKPRPAPGSGAQTKPGTPNPSYSGGAYLDDGGVKNILQSKQTNPGMGPALDHLAAGDKLTPKERKDLEALATNPNSKLTGPQRISILQGLEEDNTRKALAAGAKSVNINVGDPSGLGGLLGGGSNGGDGDSGGSGGLLSRLGRRRGGRGDSGDGGDGGSSAPTVGSPAPEVVPQSSGEVVNYAPPVTAAPAPAVATAAPLTRYRTRYLMVQNDTGEKLRVYVQTDATQEPVAYDFNPGESMPLSYNGDMLSTSRVRIWGRTAGGEEHLEFKDKDLWLVDKEGNERAYSAENMETFTFTFAS